MVSQRQANQNWRGKQSRQAQGIRQMAQHYSVASSNALITACTRGALA
jgi:hypothetical protein